MGVFDFLKRLHECELGTVEEIFEQVSSGGAKSVAIVKEIWPHLVAIRGLLKEADREDMPVMFLATLDSFMSPLSIDKKIHLMEKFIEQLKYMREEGME